MVDWYWMTQVNVRVVNNMFFNLGDDYEINGKDFISHGEIVKKIIFKDLLCKNYFYKQSTKEK
jgi:hypothetical protein